MKGFTYQNNILHADDIALTDIAEKFGTPTYIYSAGMIRAQYNALKNALQKILPAHNQPLLCYACKANSNIAVLKILEKLGAGLEIVSEGELKRGLTAGFDGQRIISTSFGKNKAEIDACLHANLLQFNIESPEELENINACAKNMDKIADVVFRLNPNVAGGGNDKINTGRKEDKFGNTAEDIIRLYGKSSEMEHVNPVGVSIHIGSQITQAEAFKPSFEKLASLTKTLREIGHHVTHLDIGGGFPITYNNESLLDLEEYAAWVRDIIVPLETKIQMEPGRYMAGNAGILLSRVEYIKTTPARQFIVLDAGMNDLIRPALYNAYHNIRPVITSGKITKTYDIVGPICESGDIFAKQREMEHVHQHDLVIFDSAGAYGFSMASNYNSRPLPAEVLVDGTHISVIRKRQSLDDLMAGESIPDWL